MVKGIRSQRVNYSEDTGPANALIVALDPPLAEYTLGLPLRVKVLHTNSAIGATLDAGCGARSIKKMDGADPAVADLPAGGVIEVTWDGTYWQLTNFGGAGAGGGGSTYTVNIPYAVDTGTVNAIKGIFSPAITVINPGFCCLVKLANTVTGPATLQVNALPPKTVLASDNGPLLPSDIVAGNIVFFKYDGTNFIADTDITVLSSFTVNVSNTSAFDSVMTSLKRKLIAPAATVTIQLGSGTYTPLAVNHVNGDRIVVKGTMLAAAPLPTDYTATAFGINTPDATANLSMLRARYGSEVQPRTAHANNLAPGVAVGLFNLGAGQPLFQDILVTGDDSRNLNQVPVIVGAVANQAQRLSLKNIAVWGCMHGITAEANGVIDANACQVTASTLGFYAHDGGGLRLRGAPTVCHGCNLGITATLGGWIMGYTDGTFYARYNSAYGVAANDHARVYFANLTATPNTNNDLLCFNTSEIALGGYTCVFSTNSPALNTVGNGASIIAQPAGIVPNF